jgi:hypothetical protein
MARRGKSGTSLPRRGIAQCASLSATERAADHDSRRITVSGRITLPYSDYL